ncbi:MAG: hypothetical protein V4736_01825 [Bdellovibrionota bacterium]
MIRKISYSLALACILLSFNNCSRPFEAKPAASLLNLNSSEGMNNQNPSTGDWPVLEPGASFNGTPCSGYGGTCVNNDKPIYACPNSGYGGGCEDLQQKPVLRTKAQPALHWIVPSDLRIVDDTLICVDADAKGGIAHVKFYGEGGSAKVTTPKFFSTTSPNGGFSKRWGYCVKLNATAWKAKTTTGFGKLYAEAIANDPRMAPRLIGTPLIDTDSKGRRYHTGELAGNYPMIIYPRTAENDWSKTVCDSGCDYKTLKLAIEAAGQDKPEAPKITINTTGFYELEDASSFYTGGVGFMVITTAPGVTATLGRSASYHPTNQVSWNWSPGWDGIEFRGKGIVFDQRNWVRMTFGSKSPWFHGVRFTNSIGTRDTTYWNGFAHPGFGTNVPGYWDDVYVEYLSGGMNAQRYAINAQVKDTLGLVFQFVHYVAGTYVRGYSNEYFRLSKPALKISYDGRNGQGSITKTGNGDAASTLILKVNGAPQGSALPLGFNKVDENPDLNAVAAAINARGMGWSAMVMNNRGGFRATLLGYPVKTNINHFADVAITPNGNEFAVGGDIHAEWSQLYSSAYSDGSGTPRQNIIFRNNVVRELQVGPFISNACHYCYDIIIKNNIFLADPEALNDISLSVGPTGFGGNVFSHYVFNHNTYQAPIIRFQTGLHDTLFSEFTNNIVGEALRSGQSSGTGYLNDQPWANTLFYRRTDSDGFADGCTGGCTAYAQNGENQVIAFNKLFTNWLSGDLSAPPGGFLSANQRKPSEKYDQRGCEFDPLMDNAGAWSNKCPATIWPF